MKKSIFALILMSVFSHSHSQTLDGVNYQSGDIVMQGYLYVPSCELSTASLNGNALTPDGGGYKLTFTEMSGIRWAKAEANAVLQEERINLVIKNCEFTQLYVALSAEKLSTSAASGDYRGEMTYLGFEGTDTTVLDPGTVADPTWSGEKDTNSDQWLYYTVGLGDAKVNGPYTAWLPLKKSKTDMSCTAAEYCQVKLNNAWYTYSHEWRQHKVLNAANEWKGDWSEAESTLDTLVSNTSQAYLPSNLVYGSDVVVPLTVRLHHGTSSSVDKMKIPHGNYQSTFTLTVRID